MPAEVHPSVAAALAASQRLQERKGRLERPKRDRQIRATKEAPSIADMVLLESVDILLAQLAE